MTLSVVAGTICLFAQNEQYQSYYLKRAELTKNQKPDSALIYAREGLEIASKEGNLKAKSDFYEILGDVLFIQFNYSLASEYFLQALSNYEQLDDLKGQSKLLNKLGRANAQAGQYEKAKQYLRKAIRLDSTRKDTDRLAESLFNYAFAFERSKEPDKAFEYLQACERLKPREDLMIRVTESYASLHEDKKEFNRAREKYLSLIDRIDELTPEGADLINNLGDTYRKTGQYEQAIPYYMKGLDITYKINYTWGKHQNHRDIAECYGSLGMYDLAYEHQQKESAIYREAVNRESEQQLYSLNLMYDLDRKDNELALQEEKTSNRTRERNLLIVIIGIISIAALYLTYLFVRLRKSQKAILAQNKLLQDRKREIESTQALLIQSEKMASIGTFTAGIAHELNNPLNLIANGINYLNSLLSEADKPAKHKSTEIESARKIIDEGLKKTKHIIKTLLTFSYPTYSGKSRRKILLLNDLVQNTVMLIKGSIPENIDVEMNLHSINAIDGYPEKIHQILINLINNAVDELKDSENKNSILLQTRDEGSNVLLIVENTGSKIPEDATSTIFEPFFTTKERGKGSGLGLWITYTLVKDQEGDISVENTPEGVRFTISFPAT